MEHSNGRVTCDTKIITRLFPVSEHLVAFQQIVTGSGFDIVIEINENTFYFVVDFKKEK